MKTALKLFLRVFLIGPIVGCGVGVAITSVFFAVCAGNEDDATWIHFLRLGAMYGGPIGAISAFAFLVSCGWLLLNESLSKLLLFLCSPALVFGLCGDIIVYICGIDSVPSGGVFPFLFAFLGFVLGYILLVCSLNN